MDISTMMMLLLASTVGLETTVPSPTAVAIALPESAQAQLESLGIRIAAPTYIPSGYRWQTVITEPCPAGARVGSNGVCRFGPSYSIVYRNPQNNSCFVVEATGGGIGGVGSEYLHSFDASLFDGKASISFGRLGSSGRTSKKATASDLRKTYDVVYGDWLGESPFYRVSNFYPKNVAACKTRLGLTPLEAQKVTESLQWLF